MTSKVTKKELIEENERLNSLIDKLLEKSETLEVALFEIKSILREGVK